LPPGIAALEPAELVPGDYLLSKALGLEAPPPAALPDLGFGSGGVYGPGAPVADQGSVASTGDFEGSLAPSGWMVVGSGLSGLSSAATGEGSTMATTITTEVPMRVLLLPATPLFCGSGFSALEGETLHLPGPPGMQVGGSIEMTGLYGGTFQWDDKCWPGEGGPEPLNKGTLAFDGNETELTEDTGQLMLGTFRTQPTRLSIEQWKGHPSWTFLGFPLKPYEQPAFPMVGCLG
jgi:hypothetical protein